MSIGCMFHPCWDIHCNVEIISALNPQTDALAAGSVSIAATAICIVPTTPLKNRKPPDLRI